MQRREMLIDILEDTVTRVLPPGYTEGDRRARLAHIRMMVSISEGEHEWIRPG